ncbi:MAG: PQQ-dependent sugar dehydrogenase [Pseudomonadota bacterium]
MTAKRFSFSAIVRAFEKRPLLTSGLLFGGLAAAFLAGALAMAVFLRPDVVKGRLVAFMPSQPQSGNEQAFEWRRWDSSLVSFDRAEIDIGDFDRGVMGGGVAAFDGLLVHVSSTGHIGALDVETGSLSYTDIRVPMDYTRIRNEVLPDKDLFEPRYYRVQDIMIRTDPDGRHMLYVSHHQFAPGDEDICQAIHRIGIHKEDSGISLDLSGWEHVYTVRDCINLPEINWDYFGDVSAGRMLASGPDTFLYSVGSYMLSYEPGGVALLQSTDNDFGKIIEINAETGKAEIFASGMRNPQGLTRDSLGRLWQTEHGPKGGDEINLVRRGEDYGWPIVTYGTDYGRPRSDWPHSPAQGRHPGYVEPIYAFVPSVGVSQIVEVPPTSAFEWWRGDFLINTLKSQELIRVRVVDERLVSMERLGLGHRLRDSVWLDNGWLAILTDGAKIILLRPAGTGEEPETVMISGYEPVQRMEAAIASTLTVVNPGQEVFRNKCGSCHSGMGPQAPAPDLTGIFKSQVGSEEGYPYSQALQNGNGRWTRSKLRKYLANPDGVYPGTAMQSIPLSNTQFDNLADYLEQTSSQ